MTAKKPEPTEAEAMAVLQKAEQKKNEAFLLGYRNLCEEHGRQLQASPVQIMVVPIQRLEGNNG